MAQTGFSPILLYSSSTTSSAPSAGNLTNSTTGSELAINITDGKLFYKDNANAVQVIAWKTTPTTAGGTGVTSYTAGDLPYYASGTALSKLGIGASGTFLTSSGTNPQWSAASSVAVTSLSFGTTGLTPSTATTGAVTVAGLLATGYGGTGLTTYTTGDILYASATNTLSKLAVGTTGYTLTVASGAPIWKPPYVRTSFTATASQTTFSATYNVGYVQVFMNGVLLNGADYTATNGTSVVLSVAANAGDIVETIAYNV